MNGTRLRPGGLRRGTPRLRPGGLRRGTAALRRSSPGAKLRAETSTRSGAASGWRDRQREMERRSASRLAFRPDASAVHRDDAMHIGQADAVPRKLLVPVQALKDSEQFLRIAGIEAHSVVLDGIDPFRSFLAPGHLDAGRPGACAEL